MKILVAEDDRASRIILTTLLNKLGYEVIAVDNGLDALKVMQQNEAPQIAFLDWMMPGMDGIEVCRRIRAAQLRYTYVIMQTARSDRQDVEFGYAAGVDDYLTKPLNALTVRQKMQAANRILQYENMLSGYAANMQRLAEERGKQLAHADRLATLGVLASGIAHEINNPATFISGNAQMIDMIWPEILKNIDANKITQNPRLEMAIKEIPGTIKGIKNGVERITRIISGLKSYARETRLKRQNFSLNAAAEAALELCHNRLKYNYQIITEFSDNLPDINGDVQQIEQVIINLVVNAADAMEDSPQKQLTVRTAQVTGYQQLTVRDSGPGIPDQIIDKIFNPFFTTKSESKGTGLGLSISKGIIEEHGGEFSVRNLAGGGAEFTFTIPS